MPGSSNYNQTNEENDYYNQTNEENGHRKYFMVSHHECMGLVRVELTTLGSAIGLATDSATGPSVSGL